MPTRQVATTRATAAAEKSSRSATAPILLATTDDKSPGPDHWKNPAGKIGFLISDNVLTEQWVFLYRQRSDAAKPFDWDTLTDLKGKRIAAVQSYTYTPEFWEMQKTGTLNVEVAQDDLGNLRRLLAGRVDGVVVERNVACYLMHAHFKREEMADLRAHPKLLTNQFTPHLMLGEKRPKSASPAAKSLPTPA